MDPISKFTHSQIVELLRRIVAVEAQGGNSVFAIDHASCSNEERILIDHVNDEGLIQCIGGADFVTGYTLTEKGKRHISQAGPVA